MTSTSAKAINDALPTTEPQPPRALFRAEHAFAQLGTQLFDFMDIGHELILLAASA
ncbi:hypothetical protein NKH85_32145 [Mesorhizobium sp. M0924]|uniref:hypothetical protein n=1 Tax=unclassified Mesorhizobium TaxID=325217 RepID=UPI00333A8F8A